MTCVRIHLQGRAQPLIPAHRLVFPKAQGPAVRPQMPVRGRSRFMFQALHVQLSIGIAFKNAIQVLRLDAV